MDRIQQSAAPLCQVVEVDVRVAVHSRVIRNGDHGLRAGVVGQDVADVGEGGGGRLVEGGGGRRRAITRVGGDVADRFHAVVVLS
jgi:hypothetical protein